MGLDVNGERLCVCTTWTHRDRSALIIFAGARRLISYPCQRSYGNQLEESWDANSLHLHFDAVVMLSGHGPTLDFRLVRWRQAWQTLHASSFALRREAWSRVHL